jgi:hypothetical protein
MANFWETFNEMNPKLSEPLPPDIFKIFYDTIQKDNRERTNEVKDDIQAILDDYTGDPTQKAVDRLTEDRLWLEGILDAWQSMHSTL